MGFNGIPVVTLQGTSLSPQGRITVAERKRGGGAAALVSSRLQLLLRLQLPLLRQH